MSLFISSLNSGSNGNCYYVGSSEEAVLIDAGLSCHETEKRMDNLGLPMETVKAIFISHEHTDHIRGAAGLSRKYKLPVYITPLTYHHAHIRVKDALRHTFAADEPIHIGAISVVPFSKHHDAGDPYSFVIGHKGIRVGVFTDIGKTCDRVIHYFRQCHACFLESNYDEDMLENGTYPQRLKKRIRGGKGHLSNSQALDLFRMHRPKHLSHLLLAHLSENNNNPEIVEQLFLAQSGNTMISIASRYRESEVFSITAGDPGEIVLHMDKAGKQLELFAV